jgi:hypothetical protein
MKTQKHSLVTFWQWYQKKFYLQHILLNETGMLYLACIFSAQDNHSFHGALPPNVYQSSPMAIKLH